MSDGRPSWPQPQPEPEPGGQPTQPVAEPGPVRPAFPQAAAPAAPAEAPPPGSEPPGRPSWTTVPPARRSIDVKLVIAVLIGLVSVTGAVVAWRSALLGEYATDKDRQAVAETVLVAQAATNREIIEQDAAARFADHLAASTSALRLERDRQALADQGDDVGAAELAAEIAEQQALAQRALELSSGPINIAEYVSQDETGVPAFDDSQFSIDLEQRIADELGVNPVQTVRDANDLRSDSQWLDGWLIALVGAVALLTFAQVSRQRQLRLGLAGLGVLVWIGSAAVAFGGM